MLIVSTFAYYYHYHLYCNIVLKVSSSCFLNTVSTHLPLYIPTQVLTFRWTLLSLLSLSLAFSLFIIHLSSSSVFWFPKIVLPFPLLFHQMFSNSQTTSLLPNHQFNAWRFMQDLKHLWLFTYTTHIKILVSYWKLEIDKADLLCLETSTCHKRYTSRSKFVVFINVIFQV